MDYMQFVQGEVLVLTYLRTCKIEKPNKASTGPHYAIIQCECCCGVDVVLATSGSPFGLRLQKNT